MTIAELLTGKPRRHQLRRLATASRKEDGGLECWKQLSAAWGSRVNDGGLWALKGQGRVSP